MAEHERTSTLGHNHNEMVTYRKDATVGKCQWDGEIGSYSMLAKGTAEERVITSYTDAVITGRQIAGIVEESPRQIRPWIEPCVTLEEGRSVRCPYLDPTSQTWCKNPEGLIPQNSGVECPLQKGPLKLITTVI